MEWTNGIGYVAAFCTTFSFLPQAIKIFQTKDTGGISITMYCVFIFGVAAWLVFGILKNEWPIIIANAITFILATFILILKIRYK